jgi:hypothetical protein
MLMKRLFCFALFAVLSLVFLAVAVLAPSHLRAVDARIVEEAGAGSLGVIESGLGLVNLEKAGVADMLLEVGQRLNLPDREKLASSIAAFKSANPEIAWWGGADPYLERIFQEHKPFEKRAGGPVAGIFVLPETRAAVLNFLGNSRRPGVQGILATRDLEETRRLPAVHTAAGQPMETAILISALLFQGDHFTHQLQEEAQWLAALASTQGQTEGLEEFYLDLLSLSRRLNWVQLAHLFRAVEDQQTVNRLAKIIRANEPQLPILYGAIHLNGSAEKVTGYLLEFGESGFDDLAWSLEHGSGAVSELLRRHQRVYHPGLREKMENPSGGLFAFLLNLSINAPFLAFLFKCWLFLAAGFFVARSISLAAAPLSPFEERLQDKRFSWSRQGLFAAGFLLFALLFAEPYLAEDTQQMEFPLRLELPVGGAAALAQLTSNLQPVMDQITLVSLIFFLLIQGIIYAVCLLRLAEIRRQPVTADLKLQLLDNEENMFDAGLYCGLGGTVVALVLLTMGVIKPSLMAAYSSTLFGIVFVGILKILHLRPFRRKLILENTLRG